jgi:metal-responsive CopG/Arc/MetJ family transcriptional regulator
MNRVKISVSLDPILLRAVDEFVAQHAGADRSKVIDQALNQWSAALQDRAMIEQYSNAGEPASERAAWRAARRAAAGRLIGGE